MTPIAVGIVNRNTRDLLRACIQGILMQAPCDLVIVDNASSDGSAEMVRAEFPNATLIHNAKNLGYGAGANQAMAACAAEYMLLLNSDTRVPRGAPQLLSDFLDRNARVAIACPRLMNPDGTLQRSCFPFPTPLDVFLDLTNIARLMRFVPVLQGRYLRTWNHMQARPVPWACGAALAIRRKAFEAVGGFDESFFMYYEEVDLCYRLAQAGWQVHFTPETEITHMGGTSTRQHHSDMAVQFFSGLVQFYRKRYSRLQLMELAVILECAALARMIRDWILLHCLGRAQRISTLGTNLIIWRRLLLGDWRRQIDRV